VVVVEGGCLGGVAQKLTVGAEGDAESHECG
jgi:hypothetical protein